MQNMLHRSLVIAVFASLLSLMAFAEDAKPETYSGIITGVPGRINTLSVKLYIKSYTTDEEAVQLANTLKNEGSDALLDAINKVERGRMAPAGRIGSDFGFVRSRQTEKGRRVIMVMERPQSFAELWRNTRSTEYPFGIVQMDLDNEGKGEGLLVVSARIKFTDENTIEIENFGTQPLRVMSIRKLK